MQTRILAKTLKKAKNIMIPKPGKNPTDVTSYLPINLLPIISKILEKLILKRIYKDANPKTWYHNTNSDSERHIPQYNSAMD
jgi:hypothetical protein